MSDTREDHGLGNALAWFGSIKEMVEALEAAQASDTEINSDAEQQRIHESVLSVDVRSAWYSPGSDAIAKQPAEYRILLTTGGPGLQLTGTLDESGQPETAELSHQDWGTPWTAVRPVGAPADQQSWDATLLTFTQQFYFGEG
jgi:hypothetical protein